MDTAPTAAARGRAARRASRRPQIQHLVTADENSLAELEVLLTTLPLCAVGRVFIEVADSDDIGTVTAPSRMTVTWLARTRRVGGIAQGGPRPSGELLTRAALAWADEMLCEESGAGLSTEVTLLAGFLSSADIAEHLTHRLGVAAERIHAPERYRLSAR